MRLILHPRAWYIALAIITACVLLFFAGRWLLIPREPEVLAEVTRGDVAEIVSVSGVAESKTAANLSFTAADVVEAVYVTEGDEVAAGDVLAILRQADLAAERSEAAASLEIARAERDELLSGPRLESRAVTDREVATAKSNLERTIAEQNEKVENARLALLSTGLEALPEDPDANDPPTPPTISGTYTCEDTGAYKVNVLSASDIDTKLKYRLLGLEVGTFFGYTESPTPMGACGLRIQFDDDSSYKSHDFEIAVPNDRTASYVTNYNTYQLALQTRENAVQAAEEALDKALKEQTLENADPRDEALRRANAAVLQAEARLELIDARIDERTIRAPYAGIITAVAITEGELAGGTGEAAITMLGDGTFEITVRVPEIDVAKLAVDGRGTATFDARAGEEVPLTLTFISPLATEIDGVAYFTAKLTFDDAPQWLRAGLNADVDIFTREERGTLRVPKRYIRTTDIGSVVYLRRGRQTFEQPVELILTGTDGYAAVRGVSEGDVIVAP